MTQDRTKRKLSKNERGSIAFVCTFAFAYICFRIKELGWQGMEDGNHLGWRMQVTYVLLGLVFLYGVIRNFYCYIKTPPDSDSNQNSS